jgi:hypothetical protein
LSSDLYTLAYVWCVEKYDFGKYFKDRGYNDDDLGTPSNPILVREKCPLDGATPMERAPFTTRKKEHTSGHSEAREQ